MGLVTRRCSEGTDGGELFLVIVTLGVGSYAVTEAIFGNVLLDVLAAFIAILTLTLPVYRWAKRSQAQQK